MALTFDHYSYGVLANAHSNKAHTQKKKITGVTNENIYSFMHEVHGSFAPYIIHMVFLHLCTDVAIK